MSEMTHVEVAELEDFDLDQVTGGSESTITKIVDTVVQAIKDVIVIKDPW